MRQEEANQLLKEIRPFQSEQDTYAQHWTNYDQSETSGSSTLEPFSTKVLPTFVNHVRARSVMCDSNVHHEWQADLVKHIWAKFKMFLDEIDCL
ncbi:hypothetical protein MTR_4g083410 [Medicago truncatula]|uniref:Uncharacterized protein n=1 Tax=Medicago truncatula TaxID=3880 RepID=G7JHL5_MEDTR|nr:hypothetical protein MTR_4g083410 [Medicago truncatula]